MKMKIALINIINKNKNFAVNKDLNGGFGTADDYDNSLASRVIKFLKSKSIRIPLVSMAYLQALLKEQGHTVNFYEGTRPKKGDKIDLILIYGSIVDYKCENYAAKLLKISFPDAKVGFCGSFPSRFPSIFSDGDFVLGGEAAAFFANDFKDLSQLNGLVKVTSLTDLDSLPCPDFTGFPIEKYGYFPAIVQKPFVTLQASLGCPYSCSYYCTYGEYQGPKIRQRSPKKVVDDILHVQKEYGIKGIQFRDPTFGLNKAFIPSLCQEIKDRNVNIKWGMETRLDLLNEDNIKMMFDVGLRNINVGIETTDEEIAKMNKRKLISESHQEKIITLCEKLGIKISAFYILGYDKDNEKSVKATINYARKLNTMTARFSVSTPYPGTGYYMQLEKEGRLLTKDWEKYSQFNLVYSHPNFSPEQIKSLLGRAIREYYFRPSYFWKVLKWKIREFWL
jgi:anaerobic magnesium-protoporphyrin IX monomethyl ester cyclase